MVETIIIEGERFIGKFSASWMVRGPEDNLNYSYEGAGVIDDKQTGEKYFFALKTNYIGRNYDLEKAIVDFKGITTFKPEPVSDESYKKIIDLSLMRMVSQVIASKQEIPTVRPEKLVLEQLVQQGLCYGRHGEMHIPFPTAQEVIANGM